MGDTNPSESHVQITLDSAIIKLQTGVVIKNIGSENGYYLRGLGKKGSQLFNKKTYLGGLAFWLIATFFLKGGTFLSTGKGFFAIFPSVGHSY